MKFDKNFYKVNMFMRDKEFSNTYHRIINTLGFSEEQDIKARDLLFKIISAKSDYLLEPKLDLFRNILKNRKMIYIFGGGPGTNIFLKGTAEEPSGIKISKITNLNHVIIAIDGSAEALMNYNITPDIIFTDLDGITLKTAQKKDLEHTFFVVHAHGDNQNRIQEFRDCILKHDNLIGTTQVESRYPIINYGGFTDGDRALYFLNNFLEPSNHVFLIGFEFGNLVGKHSKPSYPDNIKADELKRKKLSIGKELTESIILQNKASFKCLNMGFPIELNCETISLNQLDEEDLIL